MKYIRTKDGISAMEEEIIEHVIKPNEIHFIQADTIEELCDSFIAIGEKGTICAFKTFSELKHYDYTIPNEKLVKKYGAIHITDKGLIYVAKMNDKGELDLL